ncbi:MAG: hydroxyethylthiazole kinase [Pseudomonadota bacterium]
MAHARRGGAEAMLPVPGRSLSRARAEGPGMVLARMRDMVPSIHLIGAHRVLPRQADMLRAAGALPVTIDTRDEVTEIAQQTHALAVHTGAIDDKALDAMLWAAETARELNHPWVLDPAEVGMTGYRRQPAGALLTRRPSAIVAGPADIYAAAHIGAETQHEDVRAAAMDLARRTGAVVAVTGAEDFVTDGDVALTVAGGHMLLTRVDGAGAALAALVAAFLAAERDALAGTVAALAFYAAAAREAASAAQGPGSFIAALQDALFLIGPEAVDAGPRIGPA